MTEPFDDVDFDKFMKTPPTFLAKGQTYSHRETLCSWGWHWDQDQKVWKAEGFDETDPSIKAIKSLPGVTVTIQEDS